MDRFLHESSNIKYPKTKTTEEMNPKKKKMKNSDSSFVGGGFNNLHLTSQDPCSSVTNDDHHKIRAPLWQTTTTTRSVRVGRWVNESEGEDEMWVRVRVSEVVRGEWNVSEGESESQWGWGETWERRLSWELREKWVLGLGLWYIYI